MTRLPFLRRFRQCADCQRVIYNDNLCLDCSNMRVIESWRRTVQTAQRAADNECNGGICDPYSYTMCDKHEKAGQL